MSETKALICDMCGKTDIADRTTFYEVVVPGHPTKHVCVDCLSGLQKSIEILHIKNHFFFANKGKSETGRIVLY